MGVSLSHLDVPHGTYLLLSVARETEVSISQVAEWFHIWQSPEKHSGDGEGPLCLEDDKGEEAVMFPSVVVDGLWSP